MNLEKLKFPIGEFKIPEEYSAQLIDDCINIIQTFPEKLNAEIINLTDEQLDTNYRPNGWTIRQVVHHIADSHMNSLVRFKLAITEENPTVKPYYEERWGELVDSKNYPIEPSLKIIEGIHERWATLLKSLEQKDLERTFYHPEHKKEISLKYNIVFYAWHCKHHLAHITELKNRNSW